MLGGSSDVKMTLSDDAVLVAKGHHKTGSLKNSGAKPNHSPSVVSDNDVVVDLNMRRSYSMPLVSLGHYKEAQA